jgi:hypothetical protein
MHASVRSYATAGVALVGAGVIAVTPIAPPPDIRIANPAVRLAAASVANVPVNLIQAVANIPATEIQALQQLADALVVSGSWNESHPNNVWGWDPANPEMFKATVNALVPVPALSGPLGEHLNWWVAANSPMYAGCAFECPDPIGMLSVMFTVGPWEFYDADGYTFGPVINPIDGQPTEWSGQTVKLDPLEPVSSVIEYLFEEPSGFEPVSAGEFITALANLAAALQITGHLPTWIAVRETETFLKSFFPAPVTSIRAPEPAHIVTLDAAAMRASGGDVQQGEDLGAAMGSPDAQRDGVAVSDIANPSDSAAGDVLTTVQDEATPGAGGPSITAPTVPLINLTRDSMKAEPGQLGGQPGGGLAGAARSVQEKLSSAISKVTDGLTGGRAETGEAGTGDTGTGDTGE